MTTAVAYPTVLNRSAPTVADKPLARFVTHDDFVELLSNIRGATIVTIETKTEPRLLAKHPATSEPNPFKDNIVKISHVNGMINWTYVNSVNNQRAREYLTPDFQPLPRKWGRRISGSPLVEHEGNLYLEMKVQRSLSHCYETFDGRALDPAMVESYLPQRKPGRQGVEGEVILRDYSLANVVSIKMGGILFIIRAAVDVAELPSADARLSA